MGLHTHEDGWTVESQRQVTYNVQIVHGLLSTDAAELLRGGASPPRRLVVVDDTVWHEYKPSLPDWLTGLPAQYEVMTLQADESMKTRRQVDQILSAALSMDLGRRDRIMAIGGGIISDLVGVAAAELRKGTPTEIIPTTLIGLIDAALGSKRAINYHGKKNLVGAYHPARLVLLDRDFLHTLDERQIRAGIAEIKKCAEMVEPSLLDLLEHHGPDLIKHRFDHPAADEVLRRAVKAILTQLADDLFEERLRRWPDYGHTISGALEMATNGDLLHGEAVAICSAHSAVIAAQREAIDPAYFTRLINLPRTLGLPIYHKLLAQPDFLAEAIHATTLHRGNHQHWPIPSQRTPEGHEFLEDVTTDEAVTAGWTLGDLAGTGGGI